MNPVVAAAILGFVQGLTEFLPVSSSGHLVVFQQFLPVVGDEVAFDLALHLGTLVPVIWVYRQYILGIVRDLAPGPVPFRDRRGVRLAAWVVVGSIPTGVIGIVFQDLFESLFSNRLSVGVAFFVTGTLLWSTRYAQSGDVDERSMQWWQAALIGLAQGLAITPGISRSGSTIALALFLGLDREYAARFSFLLSIPAILGAFVLKARDIDMSHLGGATPIVVGALVSAVSGYVALLLLVRLVKSGDFQRFAWYLWPIAAITIAWALLG